MPKEWIDRLETASFVSWAIGFSAGLAGWLPIALCFLMVLPAYGFLFYRRRR